MTNKNDITWIAIQPLTGGMYLGAEEAIGHPAKFILSFAGLNSGELDSNLNYKSAENELYLQRYLEKHGRNPIRYDIQEKSYNANLVESLNPTIFADGSQVDLTEEYKDIDLVVAVPVCSGLSMVTTASQETKDSRNCNMRFITKYTLHVIKPKIYVFENAPTLMGTRGKSLVEEFKQIALDEGYSVLFYKTDTNLHHNCQRRPRTFVAFFKHISDNKNEEPFVWEYENKKISVKDFFKTIDNSLNGESVKTGIHNIVVLDFVKKKFGQDWRNIVGYCPMTYLVRNNMLDELAEFTRNTDLCSDRQKESILKYINKIINKTSQGLNYYSDDIYIAAEKFPSVQFRSIPNGLHPFEDRICTIREYLTMMGHPSDFEWLTGNDHRFLPKIGQNVPVKTAKFIVEQCIKSLEHWNKPRGNEFNSAFQDNIKQTKVW